MASDKAIRSKYLYLVLAAALEFLRTKPTLADLEFEIETLEADLPDHRQPTEAQYAHTATLTGRLTSMAYQAIHNYELGDHNERKLAAAARFAEQR